MKEKIVYIASFLLVFALVSGSLIYLNSMFNNIFKFDFGPIKSPVIAQVKSDSTNHSQNNIADSLRQDSLKARIDSLAAKPDSTLLAVASKPDSTKKGEKKENVAKTKADETKKTVASNKKEQPAQVTTANTTQNTPASIPSSLNAGMTKNKKDSTYNSWVKATVKLYESMDSRKAAKVIQGYSDNIARDILLKMKKKKAAEILAELKPEVVTRIISVN